MQDFRYTKEKGVTSSKKYNALAKDYGLTPSQMALAYVNSKEFVTSNIIGATNLKQLDENINSINIELNKELLEKIDIIHEKQPYPCP